MSEDMNKQSLYFPEEMLKEINEEAKRLERSKSWVVAHAWKLVHVRRIWRQEFRKQLIQRGLVVPTP